MTVKELIDHLETYREDAEVLHYADEDDLGIGWVPIKKYHIYYDDENKIVKIG